MRQKNWSIISILCAITLIACESHEQKADNAFNDFKIEKKTNMDSTIIFKDSANQLLKILPNKKTIKVDESIKYKTDLEVKVKANELAINKLKKEYNSNTKAYRKILHLEDANRLFIIQLKNFEDAVKKDRKLLEEKINQELNDINLSIKEYNLSK